jgi:23S rRNA pseudouridine1911/1915/1917 synthase
MHSWTVDRNVRLDRFLAEVAGVSRVRAREQIETGCVLVNGRLARKAALIVETGETVESTADGTPATETRVTQMDIALPVLYEDDACMVLDKPAGIPVHPGAGIPKDAPTVLHGIAKLFADRRIPFAASHVLVHRLDKDTTGCLLVAKTPDAHRTLQMQFEMRTVKKTYLALVYGIPKPAAAVIDAPIGRSTADRTKMTIMGSAAARDARTSYRTLGTGAQAAFVACDLHTGRTHQLRVHLAGIGHPILGDPSYGSAQSDALSGALGIEAVCLHAWRLAFQSPATHEVVSVESPPSATIERALGAAGVSWERA